MGTASRCFLLVHGLGATGAVWSPVAAALAGRGLGRTVAPDLPGHGAAPWLPEYRLPALAAALAAQVAGERQLYVVGHSLGGYAALDLASGWYGVQVQGVLTLGTKLAFSAAERTRAAEIAARPNRIFANREAALERYRRVAGLDGGLAPDEALLERGIVADGAGFRLAADPATALIDVPPFGALLAAATCPVRVARGEQDPLVSSAELKAVDSGALDLAGLGHNAHVEAPAVIAGLIERLLPT